MGEFTPLISELTTRHMKKEEDGDGEEPVEAGCNLWYRPYGAVDDLIECGSQGSAERYL